MRAAWHVIMLFIFSSLKAEDGYDLWLRYKPIENKTLLASYRSFLKEITIYGNSPTIQIIKNELVKAAGGMLGLVPLFNSGTSKSVGLIIGSREEKNYPIGEEG